MLSELVKDFKARNIVGDVLKHQAAVASTKFHRRETSMIDIFKSYNAFFGEPPSTDPNPAAELWLGLGLHGHEPYAKSQCFSVRTTKCSMGGILFLLSVPMTHLS